MRWVRRLVHISAIVWLVAVAPGVGGSPLPENAHSPTWMVARTEAPQGAFPLGTTSADVFAVIETDASRLVFVYGRAGARAPEATAVWHLEERSDLSYVGSAERGGTLHQVALITATNERLPRIEARLRDRLAQAKRRGDADYVVVLQGEGEDGQVRLALVEPAGHATKSRRLKRLATTVDLVTGRFRIGGAWGSLSQAAGLVACLLARDALTSPLEPLPESEPGRSASATRTGGLSKAMPAVAEPLDAPSSSTLPLDLPAPPLPPERTRTTPAITAVSGSPAAAEPVAPLPPSSEERTEIERAVIEAVNAWTAAWSRQQPSAYLATYAQAFRPDGRTVAAWRSDRRARIEAPAHINVQVGSIAFELLEHDRVSVVFEQTYRSDRYQDRVLKRLDLSREDGHFKISRELVLRTLP